MSKPVSRYLLERLCEWGTDRIFAYPGDGINGLVAAWTEMPHAPEFIQARHEEMAAFEAVGYAKFSGNVGVCMATSGPGAIHLLNGLYDAKLDHVPVVAIVGQTNMTAMGGSYQQEVDLASLYKDVCSNYVHVLGAPQQLPNLIDRAMRTAMSTQSPTAVIVPHDVQEAEYEPPGHAFKMVPSSLGVSWPEIRPDDKTIDRAADLLNNASKVAILVGQGARGAAKEVEQVAEVLGAGVAKALLGKDVIADDLSFVTGSVGLLGTRPSYELMMGCDALLTVGSNFPYTQFLPPLDQARAIQIDWDGTFIGMRYPYELNIVADAGSALRALLPKLETKKDRSWREKIELSITHWWETVERQAMTDSDLDGVVNPQRLVWELNPRLPDNAIVTADSGSAANWYARHLKVNGRQRGSLSGTLATMGPGVPYAIGAKFAHPDRPAIALVGDGAMQMNGMAELITIARYWKEWSDPRLVVAVLHNNDLNQVTWELRAMSGVKKFPDSQTIPDVDYHAFAASLGLHANKITRAEQIGSAWDKAMAADRPTVLDVHCDPNVPPIPPHANFKQMQDTAKAMLTGDEDAWEIFKTGTRHKVQEFVPDVKG